MVVLFYKSFEGPGQGAAGPEGWVVITAAHTGEGPHPSPEAMLFVLRSSVEPPPWWWWWWEQRDLLGRSL